MDDIPLKLTVATVTYQAANFLEKTIESVERQDYPYVEHIIVDGNSTDRTLELIHHYQKRNSTAKIRRELNALSEADEGLYDAMNKALEMATGDYICFLNAGDTFHSHDTLTCIAAAALRKGEPLPAAVYGDTNLVNRDGQFVRPRRLSPPEYLSWRSFRRGMLVCHQSFFALTKIAKQTPYNLDYRYASDFDWCVRVMRTAETQHRELRYARCVVTDYLEEGLTTRHHKSSLLERFRIMRRHYGFFSTLLFHGFFVVRLLLKR